MLDGKGLEAGAVGTSYLLFEAQRRETRCERWGTVSQQTLRCRYKLPKAHARNGQNTWRFGLFYVTFSSPWGPKKSDRTEPLN